MELPHRGSTHCTLPPSDSCRGLHALDAPDLNSPTERTVITSHAPPQTTTDLAPPVPDLQGEANLDALRGYAQAIAERAVTLADQARQIADAGNDEATRGAVDVSIRLAALEDAAFRAERAAKSVQSTLKLLALDEDVDGARITLDLITSGEGQAWDATTDALGQFDGIRGALRANRAASEALERTKEQSREHAARALESANQAYEIASQIEGRIQEGALSAPGVKEALDRAVSAADEAHAAAKEAEEACDAVTEATGTTAATLPAGEARTSMDAARRALGEVQKAEEEAKRAESRACASAVSQAKHAQERVKAALAGAERAILRGEKALQSSDSKEAEQQMLNAKSALSQAQAASENSSEAAERAASATRSSVAQEASTVTRALAQEAEALRAKITEAVDEVARLAGQAAARDAHLEAARDHAREIQSNAQAVRTHITSRLEALGKRCEDLEDRASLELKHQADVEGGRIIEVLDVLLGQTHLLIESRDPSEIETGTVPLRRQLEDADVKRQDFDKIANETLDVAADALEVLAREKAAQTKLEHTIAQAQADREKAGRLIEKAKRRWNELAGMLAQAELPALIELRDRAHDVIDIAEFQYGEASSSADQALDQTDIAEATEHANTTAGFAQRIEEDLPEAHVLLDRAESLATEEKRKIQESLVATREWFDRVDQDAAHLEQLQQEAHRVSADWRSDERVSSGVHKLSAALVPDPHIVDQRATLAAHAGQAGTSNDAAKLIPRSEELARKSAQHRERATTLFEQLKMLVTEVKGEADAVTQARHAIENALSLALGHTDQIANAKRQLNDALETHQASGSASQEALQHMEAIESSALSYRQQLEVEQTQFYATQDAGQAQASSQRVQELIGTLEQLAEQAQQTADTGRQAAQEELRTQKETNAKLNESLREEIQATTDSILEKNRLLAGELAQTAPELDPSDDPAVLASRDQVKELLRNNEELGAKARALSQRAATEGGEHLSTIRDQVSQIAHLTQERIETALGTLQKALDQHRASAKEQEAVDKIKEEVLSTVARAQHALTRVVETQTAMDDLAGGDAQTQALLQDLINSTRQQAKLAEATVLKAKAAQPIAEQAETLVVAQRVLDSSRKAAARVEGILRTIEQLLVDARSRVRAATEAANRALAEAKARGILPASEAVTLANTAHRWLEAAQDPSGGSSSNVQAIQEAFRALESAVQETLESAKASEHASQSAQEQDTLDGARKLSEAAIQASGRTKEAVERAREARHELLGQIAAHQEAMIRLERARAQVAEFSGQAETVAQQSRSSADALAAAITTLGHDPSPALTETLSRVVQATEDAERFAEETLSHVQSTLGASIDVEGEQSAALAGVALAHALEALERLVAAESKARLEMGRIEEEAIEIARRKEEAERQRELEVRQAEERAREAQQKEEQEQQRRELEERRAQFAQRDRPGTGAPAEQGAASGREALRARLKAGRTDAAPAPDAAKRKSRMDDRLGARPGTASGGADRSVGSYTPGSRSVGARSIRRRQRPSAATTPSKADESKD